MNKPFLAGRFVLSLTLYSFSTATQAESADQWCRRYARIATEQFAEANAFNRCRRRDARWHSNQRGHFDWCLTATEQAARAEDGARRAHLATCKATRPD